MKQKLDDNYDINVMNMIPASETVEGFEIIEATFIKNREEVKMKILIQDYIDAIKQIFKMKDGKFILEVDDADTVEYFYSENINDLL